MESKVLYSVYRIKYGKTELIGTFQNPYDAHTIGKKYDEPNAVIEIRKVSSNKKLE